MRRIALLPLLLCACGPRVAVTATDVPEAAARLDVLVQVGERPAQRPVQFPIAEELRRYRELHLGLELPPGGEGPLGVWLLAYDEPGCLLAIGSAQGDGAAVPLTVPLREPVAGCPNQRQTDPLLLSAQPALVPSAGGVDVRLRGTGFAPGAQVLVGEMPVDAVFESPLSLRFRAPPGAFGKPVALSVKNLDGGRSPAGPVALRYQEPEVELVPAAPSPVPRGPFLDVADVTGDGLPDLLSAGFIAPGGAAVLRNQRAGRFNDPAPISLPPLAVDNARTSTLLVLGGDLDGDRLADVLEVQAVGASKARLVFRRSRRLRPQDPLPLTEDDPDFVAVPLQDGLVFIGAALGHADEDALADLFLVLRTPQDQHLLRVLLNPPEAPGDFRAARSSDCPLLRSGYQSDPNLAVADLDGDGRDDVVLPIVDRGAGEPHFSALLTRPGGLCGPRRDYRLPQQQAADDRFAYAALGDVDGDGHPDLAAGGNSLLVVPSDGRGGFRLQQASYQRAAAVSFLAVADLNGDGPAEVLGVTYAEKEGRKTIDQLRVWTRQPDQSGQLTFLQTRAYSLRAGLEPSSEAGIGRVLCRDLDGDLRPDVIVSRNHAFFAKPPESTPDSVVVFLNQPRRGAP